MKIAVIGGGASGIVCAIYARRTNKKNNVTVFERSDRILKKLLATGNGRCNLSNANISELNYTSSTPGFIGEVLSAFTPEEERQFFESIGIMMCEEDGRLYPYSRRAGSVLDALRFECEHLGIKICTNSFIDRIEKTSRGFNISGALFDKVVLSVGGASAPSFGTDGNGIKLLEGLGHSTVPFSYALAPVKVRESVKQLKGIRARGSVSLVIWGKKQRTEHGEIQFTDYGLSGIAIMQLSRLCNEKSTLSIDLLPEYSQEELSDILKKRKELLSHLRAEDFLSGILHKTLGIYILGCCKIPAGLTSGELTNKDIENLSAKIKSLSFSVVSVLGKEQSQASAGGASLSEFDPRTLESKKCQGLYSTGELLDCVGDCGGYNLHWAWATGSVAGTHVGG